MSKYQKFQVETWHRSQIQGAPYNPRQIDSYARKKLEANLKKVGLLDTLVVNRRTGNLVSGHQRLACLDALEKSPDYGITVSVVELSDKQEREQNIFFNNPASQGTWDVALLGDMLKEGLEIEATGFDNMDLQVLFDSTDLAGMFALEKAPEAVQSAVAELQGVIDNSKAKRDDDKKAAEIAAMKARREKFKGDYNAELDTEFYLIVVCGSRNESERLNAAMGLPRDGRYVDGRMLGHKLGVDLGQPEQNT